ncbi:hypothetical protein Aperf_G00000073257 [Anoplocephala perfoliata]
MVKLGARTEGDYFKWRGDRGRKMPATEVNSVNWSHKACPSFHPGIFLPSNILDPSLPLSSAVAPIRVDDGSLSIFINDAYSTMLRITVLTFGPITLRKYTLSYKAKNMYVRICWKKKRTNWCSIEWGLVWTSVIEDFVSSIGGCLRELASADSMFALGYLRIDLRRLEKMLDCVHLTLLPFKNAGDGIKVLEL